MKAQLCVIFLSVVVLLVGPLRAQPPGGTVPDAPRTGPDAKKAEPRAKDEDEKKDAGDKKEAQPKKAEDQVKPLEPITEDIKLFNGKDLSNFYTYLGPAKKGAMPLGKNNDPDKVFSVVDGSIRVSGQVWGGLTTEKEYENYHLVAEYKWGEKTWGAREKAARNSGLFIHGKGEDGAVGGFWLEGIEYQILEGGTGDLLLKGKNAVTLFATAEQRGKQWRFDPKAEPKEFKSGGVLWIYHDADWKDTLGFRGKEDVERPVGEWNTLECTCSGDKITFMLNGKFINQATKSSLKRGKIMIQSEGAEIFFRRVDLQPIKKPAPAKRDISTTGVAIRKPEPLAKEIKLFNGTDLTNFYTYLGPPAKGEAALGKNNDPNKVFSVVDGMLRVSGQTFGFLGTEKEFESYRLVTEFKWGEKTWPPREKDARNSGILLHAVGEDGAAFGWWQESIECQLMEGSTGDLIIVKGAGTPKMTVTAEKRGKYYWYSPTGTPLTFKSGRVSWLNHDPDWKDVKGFRGKDDVEKSPGEWNTLECVCDAGGKITVFLNGVKVNECSRCSHTRGKILVQSEGAEIFFRRIDLVPLGNR